MVDRLEGVSNRLMPHYGPQKAGARRLCRYNAGPEVVSYLLHKGMPLTDIKAMVLDGPDGKLAGPRVGGQTGSAIPFTREECLSI